MTQPHTELYVHCVWATWDRLPLITVDFEPRLFSAMAAKCRALGCRAIAIGGLPDHVHLLARIAPTVSVSELMRHVKGSTSHLITHEILTDQAFKWQGSYGAFTISSAGVAIVARYVRGQKERHRLQELDARLEGRQESIDVGEPAAPL